VTDHNLWNFTGSGLKSQVKNGIQYKIFFKKAQLIDVNADRVPEKMCPKGKS